MTISLVKIGHVTGIIVTWIFIQLPLFCLAATLATKLSDAILLRRAVYHLQNLAVESHGFLVI